ncbi:MAG: DUF5667 domain-containing protein [Patescibacteria group bacterium]
MSLSEEKRAQMKRNIMASINEPQRESVGAFGFASLVAKIKEISAQVKPNLTFRAILKDKLLTLFEMRSAGNFATFGWMKQYRKFGVSLLAFVFVFTIVFNFVFHIERVEASYSTVLEDVQGDVHVLRNAQVIVGTSQLLLKADDIIKTGAKSQVSIRFLDQSVTRLSENTEIKISKLFVNPSNKTETLVEVILHEGRLWARVVNLIGNVSSFQVKAKNTVAVAKKKAAFDVSISDKGKAKVSAIQNRVELTVATNNKIIETTLVKGFTAEVKTNEPLAPQIHSETPDEAKDQWVTDNLEKDKQYFETVRQETRNQIAGQIKFLPGDPLYAMKQFSESTGLAFTLDEFEKRLKMLTMASEKLAEAELLFERGDGERGQTLLVEFKAQIASILEWANGIEAQDPTRALELKTKITETLNVYQKQLALILPNDPLYKVKTAVSELQVAVAPGDVQKTEERISQAGDKLLEAHDLIERGDSAGAEKQIAAYTQAISEAVSDVRNLSTEDREQAVSTLLDSKAEDLKTLEVISTTQPVQEIIQDDGPEAEDMEIRRNRTNITIMTGSSTPAEIGTTTNSTLIDGSVSTDENQKSVTLEQLEKTVSEAKTETLTKMGEAVLSVQTQQPSTEVLKQLDSMRKLDMNGQPMMNVTVSKDNVTIRTNENLINVTPTITQQLPTVDSKTPVSLPVQP